MIKILRSSLLLLSLILLVGCVGTPNVSFNAAMNRDIRKIAVVPPNQQKELTIFYYNHPGMSFGLIGALAAASEFSSKSKEYTKLVKPTGFNANKYFLSKLTYYLKKANYRISMLPVNPKRKAKFLTEFPNINTHAYLDLLIYDVGYVAGSPAAAYKPNARVHARLVRKENKAVVYEKIIASGESFALGKNIDYVGTSKAYHYKDFKALKSHASKSSMGLKIALDRIAKRLALSLRRR